MKPSTGIVSPNVRPDFKAQEIKKIEDELLKKQTLSPFFPPWWGRWKIAAEARRIFAGRLYSAKKSG